GNAWHEVLDLCKTGFANKMSTLSDSIIREIRAEVQQGVVVLKGEANSMTVGRDRPVSKQLTTLMEKVQQVETEVLERPAVDLTPVLQEVRNSELACLNANRLLGQRLGEMTEMHAQLGDQVKSSGASVMNVLQRIEDKLSQLETRVQQSEDKLLGDVSKVQKTLNGSASQIINEVQKLQQQDDRHYSDLGKSGKD
ncbi:unnamed protein product, partial [Polarella glacialis]